MAELTVVGNVNLPDIPRGRAVTVERTARIDGLLASGRIVQVDDPSDDTPSTEPHAGASGDEPDGGHNHPSGGDGDDTGDLTASDG